tara:strand:+ start:1408 stop:1698 length:291 start_codon:yes stop_codon:yes gene_type:complete
MKQTLRGNKVYLTDNGSYRYEDDNTSTVDNWETKPCGTCGLTFTKDGHDGCIGTLKGVINACCGHGTINDAYVQFNGNNTIRGQKAINYIEKHKPS